MCAIIFCGVYGLAGDVSVGPHTGMADQIIRAKYAHPQKQDSDSPQMVEFGSLKISPVLSMGTGVDQLQILGAAYDAQIAAENNVNAVFDRECGTKLELIEGISDPRASIVTHIGDTHTHTGELMLGTLLLHPADASEGVYKRQKIVRALAECTDSEIQVRLANALETLKATEPYVLSLWREPSESEQMILKSFYPAYAPAIALGAWERFNQIMLSIGVAQSILLPVAAINFVAKKVKEEIKIFSGEEITRMKALEVLYADFAKVSLAKRGAIGAYVGVMLGLLSYNGYQVYKLNKIHWRYFNALRIRVLYLERYLAAAEELRMIMAQLDPAFVWPTQISKRMEQLQYALETGGYDRPLLPGLLAPAGRVLNIYQNAREIRAELVPIMQAVGTVDAYATVARLFQRMQKERVRYSFVECVDQDLPVIQINQFWNPLIDYKKVVVNSVQLGDEYNNRLLILTGPNTGGKTTVIKGLLLSIIMGQSFGIAPCEHMRFTPFARLFSYMNIADDISKGESLFAAEVRRAKELVVAIRSRVGHVFAIVDELFSGTAPREGAAASCQFASNVVREDNALLSIATHFSEMTDLEKPGSKIKNYRVTVTRNPDGTIHRTFTLEPGINTVNIAFDLLAEQGVFA